MNAERICPQEKRLYTTLCNEGYCGRDVFERTGYCVWHASAEYAAQLRHREQRAAVARRWTRRVLFIVVVPPVAVAIAGGLWRLAIWVVAQ